MAVRLAVNFRILKLKPRMGLWPATNCGHNWGRPFKQYRRPGASNILADARKHGEVVALNKDVLFEKLAPHDQTHVLACWDDLSAGERTLLAAQLCEVDLPLLAGLHRGEVRPTDWADLARRAVAPPAYRLGDEANAISPQEARRRGAEALAVGEVGAVLVAGGQGSRLGFEHPKGMFAIGPISGASLFQILLEKIAGHRASSGGAIPLYVMTSPATDAETRVYLAEHGNFGLPADAVRVFCQGTMPAVDAATGKLLLAEKHRLALSPDGHGGCLAALARSEALDDMEQRGVRYLFYFQVDNPLAPVCDPELLGYHILSHSRKGTEMSTLVVRKQTPRDRVGNVASIDGRLHVLEYSDFNPLDNALVDRRDAAGQPIFWAGSIAVHGFNVAFLRRESRQAASLPFHVAHKAVSFVNSRGEVEVPRQPNACKFERFIFDLMPAAEAAIVIEGDEAEVFAPLKNAPGESRDTPEFVRERLAAQARRWLRMAGNEVDDKSPVEISPLLAQNDDEARRRLPTGLAIREPRYFRQGGS